MTGPLAALLPAGLRDAIIEDCRRVLPNEACGLLAGNAPFGQGGRPTRWLPARNALASPYRFEIDPDDLLRLSLDIDDAGEVVWAVVHSHVGSPAIPSPSDRRGDHHPAALQVVVALERRGAAAEADGAELRAWQLGPAGLDEVAILGD